MQSNEPGQVIDPLPLNLDQTRAFEDILAVFTSPGWAHLERQLRDNQERCGNVRFAAQGLDFARGQCEVLDNLVNWPEMWKNLYAAAQSGTVEVSPEFGR